MPYILPQDTATRRLGAVPSGRVPPGRLRAGLVSSGLPAERLAAARAAGARRRQRFAARHPELLNTRAGIPPALIPYFFPVGAARIASARRQPMSGDYINQRFVIPTNSLGQPITPHMGGAFVDSTWMEPPYRQLQLGQSFLDEETIPGVKNKYALGGLLAFLVLAGGRRR